MFGYHSAANKTASKGSTTMPPGVPHPQAGMPLGPYSERCACGGVTGICGTAQVRQDRQVVLPWPRCNTTNEFVICLVVCGIVQGASKWRSHQKTTKHQTWDPIYNMN